MDDPLRAIAHQTAQQTTTAAADATAASNTASSTATERDETSQTASTVVSDSNDEIQSSSTDSRLPPFMEMSLEEQRTEWLAHFLHSPSSFHARAVHRSVDDKGLRGTTIRSIYWKLFLGELHRTDMNDWKTSMQSRRNAYEALCEKHHVKRVKLRGAVEPTLPGQRSRSSSSAAPNGSVADELLSSDPNISNPLSKSSENPWTKYFHDNELSETIRHDLNRTHQDNEFFTHESVQDILFNVLFVWAKEIGNDTDGRYRQGFNETISPLILVLLRESQWKESWASLPSTGAAPGANDDLLACVLDRDYVEHDLYYLFGRILQQIGQYFIKIDVNPKNKEAAAAALQKKKKSILAGEIQPENKESIHDQSPIVKKCHYIQHILLSTLDPQLYAHLVSMDVSPNLYILRWYRLMLCREFHLEDTLVIWDVIFATAERPGDETSPSASAASNPALSPHASPLPSAATTTAAAGNANDSLHSNAFVLTEYMCIAMLLYVRSALLQGDNVYCLRRLLRYPPVEDIRVLLARALHFLNSWKLIVSDPTLTREIFDPTAISEAERMNSSEHWERITGGMGADAPLEENEDGHAASAPPSRSLPHHHQQHHSHHSHHEKKRHNESSSRLGISSDSSSGPAQVAKAYLSDGFSTLKNLVKGAVSKAGEIPQSANAHARSAHQSPPSNFHPPKKQANTLPANAANRKLLQASGISHFLSPSSFLTGGTPTPSPSPSSTSTHGGASASASPPPVLSAKEHDELVLLRRDLAAAEKRLVKQHEESNKQLRVLAMQLEDARSVQRQMGELMSEVLQNMENEYEACSTAAEENGDAVATDAKESPKQPRPFSEDVLLNSVAELKHIKDVLIGRLGLNDIIQHLQTAASTSSTATAADSTSASPLDTASASPPATAASASGVSAAQPSPPHRREKLIQDIAALEARQRESAREEAAMASAAGGSFPYNLPPPPEKKFAPLFEAEAPKRDAVSELFALDETDAVPGLYPTVHKVTVDKEKEKEREKEEEKKAKEKEEQEKAAAAAAATAAAAKSAAPATTATTTVAAAAAPAATTPSNANNNGIIDPLRSPGGSASAAAPAVAAASASASAAPAASSAILSTLLSSPSSTGGLFDNSPPSSPFSGPATKKKGFNPAFALEEEDNSILLPNAQQFKAPPVSYKPPPPKPGAATAAPKKTFNDPLFSSNDSVEDWLKK